MVKNSAPANEEDDKHEDKNISDDPVTHSAAKDACEVLLNTLSTIRLRFSCCMSPLFLHYVIIQKNMLQPIK